MNTTAQQKKRIPTFDIAKGIGILAVITGHMSYFSSSHPLHWVIFSFHMPLFFLVAGYFFRPTTAMNMAKKRFHQLIVPYIVTGIIIAVLASVKEAALGDLSKTPHVFIDWILKVAFGSGTHSSYFFGITYIGPIWFLLALFFAQVFYTFIADKKYAWIVSLLLFVAGVVTAPLLWLPWSIQSAMTSLLFIHVGYVIRKHNWFDPHKVQLIPFALSFIVWVVVVYVDHGKNYFASNYFVCEPADVLGGITGTLVVLWISIWIARIPVVSSLLEKAGTYSLVILCAHAIEVSVFPWSKVISKLSYMDLYPSLIGACVIIMMKLLIVTIAVLIVQRVPLLAKIYGLKK
ncbi:MAG: acyltransferase family protein [Actinomycetaceae bacterium]|nr:acyltransferase family protein [Actinomycetaceae bacterium]